MKESDQLEALAEAVRNIDLSKLSNPSSLPKSLLLDSAGDLEIYNGPFSALNTDARLVIVGITPGFTQLRNALAELQRQVTSSSLNPSEIKRKAAFSGGMRPNLIAMLDAIGIPALLGLSTSDQLFGDANHLLHTTSALRYPVFVKGKNYAGQPNMTTHPLLCNHLLAHFGEEAANLKKALFVPLGSKVSEALAWLSKRGVLQEERILEGLPHPSPANAERIAYFLRKKPKSALSRVTNGDAIDRERGAIMEKVRKFQQMGAMTGRDGGTAIGRSVLLHSERPYLDSADGR